VKEVVEAGILFNIMAALLGQFTNMYEHDYWPAFQASVYNQQADLFNRVWPASFFCKKFVENANIRRSKRTCTFHICCKTAGSSSGFEIRTIL
jgi:hypothetical protein